MAASSKNHALAVPFRRQLDSNVAASEPVPRSRPSNALLPVQNPARSQHSLHPRMQGARRHMQLQGSADRRASASESRSVEADPTSPANPRLGDGKLETWPRCWAGQGIHTTRERRDNVWSLNRTWTSVAPYRAMYMAVMVLTGFTRSVDCMYAVCKGRPCIQKMVHTTRKRFPFGTLACLQVL